MGSPKNGIFIIQGEISLVVTAMRRSSRWNTHAHHDDEGDPLLGSFSQLKDILNNISDLSDVEPNVFLSPFLEVVRSEDTTGPITGLALTSVNKFLSYSLVDPSCEAAAAAIENIADAVTHARFVGTDPGSDEVVLMKILHVLRTLLLAPAGVLLTNESVCEIMQSCFRICFEMRLSELLRKSAEHTLMDMVQLLFSRLPQFKEDPKWSANMKKLKMRTGGVEQARMSRRKKSPKPKAKRQSAAGNKVKTAGTSSEPSEKGTRTDGSGQVIDGEVEATSEKVSRTEGTSQDTDSVYRQEESSQRDAEGETTCTDTNTTQDADEKISMTDSAVDFSSVTDTVSDSGASYVSASRESIATTPVAGTSVIDIVKGFQEADLQEDGNRSSKDAPPAYGDLYEGEDLSRTESTADLKEHIYLELPRDESLVRSCSELSLPQSETGDDESLQSTVSTTDQSDTHNKEDYVNQQGVRFTPHHPIHEGSGPLIPYGLPCVRELFRFLISLTNPIDRHNTDVMIHMGLSLLTVALESGADFIGQFSSLVFLVKDDMCRHLFLLVQSERLSLASASLRVCFLLFESLRSHLKLQLEMYLTRLSEIITSDHPRITYEIRELALESIVQLWRIPGLVTELYLNYDCDLYCTNLFEDLTKLLSKNAFPVAGLFSTHLLSLDALLTVVDTVEQHCHSRILKSTGKLADSGKGEGQSPAHSEVTKGQTEETEDKLVGPPTTGYAMAQRLLQKKDSVPVSDQSTRSNKLRKGPYIKPNRMLVNDRDLPSHEELAAIKQKKRVYQTGTEYFNNKPAKGITYLQEQRLLSDPLDPGEVITFIKENPKIDKKMLGEYITRRSNSKLLEAFVKSFHFEDLRIDEALRQYLEAFRLPGEAPVISLVMEHFADHWHKSNGEPFFNADAAFTLAYAIIMLNVDQHNHNVKKQNIPMTVEQFKKNLKKTNGNEDFEGEMLDEIYNAIRNEEIVMPSEQTGLVRENYLWKVLLKRGTSKEGGFTHAPTGQFDHELFTLIWGPTVAALSFVFDKSSDEGIISKAISGFRKCAMISAHYGMSDVFDNLVISLCKFTTLLSSVEAPDTIPILFGMNMKAQLAARTVFNLAHRHGDILREGWKNILDCMLQLYRAKLLPKSMVEVEDFVSPTGKMCLIKEESQSMQRSETGVLSSFYSYFTMSEPISKKEPSPEEEEAMKLARRCIQDCQLEQMIVDSRFLREESLHELIKALIFASQGPEAHDSMGTIYDEDAAVFFFEQFITCILQNRDRVSPVWQSVKEHIYSVVVNCHDHTFMVERAVVGLLRISIRLLRREDIAPQVLASLQILLMMKPKVIHSISQQISFGLHDLLRTNAANIHSNDDWYTLFTLLEVVGSGISPPPVLQVNSGVDVTEGLIEAGAQSDSEVPSSSQTHSTAERGYTSDSELETQGAKMTATCQRSQSGELEVSPVAENSSWMMVNKDDTFQRRAPVNQYSIELQEHLQYCDTKSLLKSSETLSFLVRDAAHVTPLNFESCVHAIRAFAEASLNGGLKKLSTTPPRVHKGKKHKKKQQERIKKSSSSPSQLQNGGRNSEDEDDPDGTDAELHSLSIQLLDLMHTLHTRANSIYTSWADESKDKNNDVPMCTGHESLWIKCWCPLLQGIARLCCDARRQVRGQALTYLQRALLVHDLQTLSAVEWEACFNKILFPLLTKLLENINTQDPSGMEETRMRASTLLCKVFLQHLSPLLSLSTFTALWLTILDFMDKYMHVDRSDLLTEAIPESLKNMLLVMDTAGIFQTGDGHNSQLWKLTWDRIGTFLPHLKEELFKTPDPEPSTKLAMDRDGDNTGQSKELSPQSETVQGAAPSDGDDDKEANQHTSSGVSLSTEVSSSSSNSNNISSNINTVSPSEQEQLPTAASYFLHTPLPSLSAAVTGSSVVRPQDQASNPGTDTSVMSSSPGHPVTVGPTLPLLLDPELMKDSSQVSRAQCSSTSPVNPGPQRAGSPSNIVSYPMNRVHDI